MKKITVKEYMRRRAEFAEGVLDMLEGKTEWDADLIDNIGLLAVDLGLGKPNRTGWFRRTPAPSKGSK